MSTIDHLAALEAQNRLLRRLCKLTSACALLLAVLLIAGWKQGIPDVIRARRFEVVNTTFDKVAAVMSADVHGGGTVSLSTADGFTSIVLGEDDHQDAGIHLFEHWQHGEVASLDAAEAGRLILKSGYAPTGGKAWQVDLGKDASGSVGLRMGLREGLIPLLGVTLDRERKPMIQFRDSERLTSAWVTQPYGDMIVFRNAVEKGVVPDGNFLQINSPPSAITRELKFQRDTWPPKPPAPTKKGGKR